jgi:hypothetical protein
MADESKAYIGIADRALEQGVEKIDSQNSTKPGA